MKNLIACIYEGSAEKAILEILLENNALIFSKEQLLEEEILHVRSSRKFEVKYLSKGFGERSIKIYRVIDSKKEAFPISKEYKDKVEVIDILTSPEIEMLVIIKEGKWEEFNRKYKSYIKPSEYCKQILKFNEVKSYNFVKEYFKDINILIKVIVEYNRISDKKKKNLTTIIKEDLLR